ncbi:MAG: hypothetical protein IKN74_05845 [Clostridia bacterium]|nr:hypothetical protein [Clostridia bacterium]
MGPLRNQNTGYDYNNYYANNNYNAYNNYNNYNNYYEPRKKFNITKLLILIAIILLIIGIVVFSKNGKSENVTNTGPSSSQSEPSSPSSAFAYFSDDSGSVSIELKSLYNLKKLSPTNNHLLELRSEENLSIYVSKLPASEEDNFAEIVNNDKENFKTKVQFFSNVSELKELKIGSIPAYIYSLQYLDVESKAVYYLQVVWLYKGDSYYVIDIEYPLDNESNFSSVLTETLKTLNIN